MPGLTTAGFDAKSLDAVLTEIEGAERTTIAADLDTSAESVVGELNAIMATKLRELWELAQLVYDARDPRNAAFAQLDALAALTGTTRLPATKGRVSLTLTVAAGQTVAAGAVAQVAGQPDNRWVTLEPAVNATGSPLAVTVAAQAQTAGRYLANAGQISVIATPVSGWTAVTNAADAAPGTEVETDAALRARREAELAAPGTGTVPAIRADLLALRNADGTPTIAGATVEENTSAYPDLYGRPPHSVEAVVQFPAGLSGAGLVAAQQAVADQLWASKPAGIDLYGSASGTAVDAQGAPHAVRYSVPTLVPVYVTVTLAVDPAAYAGDAAVKDATVAYGAAFAMGDDVIRARVSAAAIAVPGVLDVVDVELGTAPGALAPLNLTIGRREVATFDTSRVTVVR